MNNSFISWIYDSCKDLRTIGCKISELGIISTFTGGTGKIVVTVLELSVKLPTSDIVRTVDTGLIFSDIGVTVSIEVKLLEPIWLGPSE